MVAGSSWPFRNRGSITSIMHQKHIIQTTASSSSHQTTKKVEYPGKINKEHSNRKNRDVYTRTRQNRWTNTNQEEQEPPPWRNHVLQKSGHLIQHPTCILSGQPCKFVQVRGYPLNVFCFSLGMPENKRKRDNHLKTICCWLDIEGIKYIMIREFSTCSLLLFGWRHGVDIIHAFSQPID